jgi:adenylate kinase family enzyme
MKIMQLKEANLAKSIVLVFGRLCSGKGTFCEPYIKKGYNHITTSDIVKKVSGFTTRDQLQTTKDMDTLIIEEMVTYIRDNQPIVVDGIRQQSIIEALVNEFGRESIDMIWLEAPKNIRQQRYTDRAATKDTKSFDDAEAGDIKLGINDVEQYAKSNGKTVNNF